jgi:UDPglucose 6-dehydrogenase
VGLTTALNLVGAGHTVRLVEVDDARSSALSNGRAPFHEPGVTQALQTALASTRLTIATVHVASLADVVFVCVGTPMHDDGSADLRDVVAALQQALVYRHEHTALVVRSTLPIGATGELAGSSGWPSRCVFSLPEFLREGSALADSQEPSRIVIGQAARVDEEAVLHLLACVAHMRAPILRASWADAEIIKNASNAYLALKLSLTNELAGLCEEYGANVDTVLDAIGRDPRIGTSYMHPSYGFGGSCLPKELSTIARAGQSRGLTMHVAAAASAANISHQQRFVALIESVLLPSAHSEVALLGLAFKAGTDDVRSSPSLFVGSELLKKAIVVRAYDPQAGENAARVLPKLHVVESLDEAVRGVDAAIIATEWPEFRDADWPRLGRLMRQRVVIDGRRLLRSNEMRRAGFNYFAIGSRRD